MLPWHLTGSLCERRSAEGQRGKEAKKWMAEGCKARANARRRREGCGHADSCKGRDPEASKGQRRHQGLCWRCGLVGHKAEDVVDEEERTKMVNTRKKSEASGLWEALTLFGMSRDETWRYDLLKAS